MKRGWWVAKFIVFGILMVILFGSVTQMLWNWLVPVLFTGPVITFWQALGLLTLSKILFWGLGGGRWGHYRKGEWKPYMKDRMARMTPEDRVRFKKKMEEKWCSWKEDTSTQESGTSNG